MLDINAVVGMVRLVLSIDMSVFLMPPRPQRVLSLSSLSFSGPDGSWVKDLMLRRINRHYILIALYYPQRGIKCALINPLP